MGWLFIFFSRFNLSPNLDLKTISELCPFNYTGADFYALCSDAMLKAMVRTIKFVDKKIGTIELFFYLIFFKKRNYHLIQTIL